MPAFDSYSSGVMAASVSTLLVFPVFKLSERQQLASSDPRRAVLASLRAEGMRAMLLRGLSPPLLQRLVCRSLMYGNYEVALNQLEYVGFRRKNHSTQSAAALLAGSLEAVLVPCERVQALLVDPRHNTRFPHVFAVLVALVRQRNALRELYVGFTPVLFRNGPSFALYLWLKDLTAEQLPKIVQQNAFLAGAFSGGVASFVTGIVFYPINTIKMNIQAHVEGEHLGFLTTTRLVASRGIGHLYAGLGAHCMGSVLSWAIFQGLYQLLTNR